MSSPAENDRPRRSERWLEGRTQKNSLRPRHAAYLIIAFWAAAVLVFGTLERLIDPDTFDNIWLGMWWALQTVTTVGYGDVVPASTAGKVLASFLLLGGLSMIAVVTGAITSGFVARAQAQRQAAGDDPVMRKLEEISGQLEAVRAELDGRSKDSGPA